MEDGMAKSLATLRLRAHVRAASIWWGIFIIMAMGARYFNADSGNRCAFLYEADATHFHAEKPRDALRCRDDE